MARIMDTEDRSPRQKEFIAAAARLFAERGYRAVGINEISAELGLSGPAIYHHYPSKEALLVAVFEDAITAHLERIRDIVDSAGDPRETLAAIIDHHISFVFERAANIITWRTDFRHLPEADGRRIRYLQRLYTAEWVRTVRKIRPELVEVQVKAMCDAAIALIQSPTEFHSGLTRDQLAPMLAAMASHALIDAEVVPLRAAGGADNLVA